MQEDVSSESTGRALRAQPTLIELDNGRMITSTGRWNDGLLLGYLVQAEADYQFRVSRAANEAAGREKYNYGWVLVGELARVAWGQSSITTKARARTCISRMFRFAATERAVLISVDHDATDHNKIVAAKVYDKASPREQALMFAKLSKLLNTRELSHDQFEAARSLSGLDGIAA
jgi:hypothetical protein